MVLRPFLGTEIRSFVAGMNIAIRTEHICDAMKMSTNGRILKATTVDVMDPTSKSNQMLTCQNSTR
jgi:hypothetical protein